MEYLLENKEAIISIVLGLYGVAEVVVRLTPSEKDDAILKKVALWVSKFVDLFIPNLKKGGGVQNKNFFIRKK